ncbi:unnamed protein product [Rhizoctonia solani]|uniref:Uncharacterized protein n=2 Tax=Rhizoctonia solani TaxID=456999 RepID=A0A8H3D8C0_9AGAM|nr:hypothetical protein V565_134020 [Rhizoctonia solani 123E]CAE6517406.1 unnamed protein product [Rhizoctonia solani]
MAPRTKPHRTLSAASRNHSTTSLHKAEGRLTGLTTIHKDKPAGNPRDALPKSKKHSSSSSALATKRTASKTSVHRTSTPRLAQQQMKPEAAQVDKRPADDEGWISSDDEDDELDDDEILVLQTQRAQRNAREAEKLKAAVKAAELEIIAKQREAQAQLAEESGEKHTTMSPAQIESLLPVPRSTQSSPAKPSPPQVRQQTTPAPTKQPQAPIARQPLPSHYPEPPRHAPEPSRQVPATLAPVIQHVPDHTKHTFPTKASPSPPAPLPSARNGSRLSDPMVPQPHTNGAHDKSPLNDRSSTRHSKPDDGHPSRPQPRRSQSHLIRPVVLTPGRSHTLAAPARPHPLFRAPSILTKAVPALSPLTAPPYLSAHSAKAQISSSPPPATPSSGSPPHTRQPSLSSSTHTLPTLQISPTAALAASVSSLPHSPHSSPTASFKHIPERERTISAVSSTAALHALHSHHPHRKPYRSIGTIALSTFPPEPVDTYNGGMYPGSGSSVGGVAPGGAAAVVGASGGMYGGKPGPVHALLPAPYMATHMSIERWYAPARDAVGRVVRGRPTPA